MVKDVKRRYRLATAMTAFLTIAIVLGYDTSIGLGIRAQLGQHDAILHQAMERYNKGEVAEAVRELVPLVRAGHFPSFELLCKRVSNGDPAAKQTDQCMSVLGEQPAQWLEVLTEVAFLEQAWGVAAEILEQRISSGDSRAYYDKARLVRLSPTGQYDRADFEDALRLSSQAGDPRGQYVSVLVALNESSKEILEPVISEVLERSPKLSDADAYFELGKLMQIGLIASDLSYVEVMRRADESGNRHASRYLAQYYISNPDQDPEGTERALWIEKAAQFGDPVAQYNRAVDILAASPDLDDLYRAVSLLDSSAATGFVPALNLLGATLWNHPRLLEKLPGDVSPLAILEMAAAKDDANAHFNLGSIYLFQNDHHKAALHLRRSALLGNIHANDLLIKTINLDGR